MLSESAIQDVIRKLDNSCPACDLRLRGFSIPVLSDFCSQCLIRLYEAKSKNMITPYEYEFHTHKRKEIIRELKNRKIFL